MKIGNFEIKFSKDAPREIPAEVKTLSPFGVLFQTARENLGLGDQVTRPYEQVLNIYKAVKAIADNVGQVSYEITSWSSGAKVEDKELEAFLDNPCKEEKLSFCDFMQRLAGFYALHGEVFIRKEMTVGTMSGSQKLPPSLTILEPSRMKELTEQGGLKLVSWKYNDSPLTVEEVISICDFNPYNRFRGMSPILPARLDMEMDYQASAFNKAFFDNNAIPNLFLTSENPMTDAQRKRLTEWLESVNKGAKKSFKTTIFDSGVEPKTVSGTHKDMEFIEQKKYTRDELLGTWRSPKALFNITDTLNYATFTGQMKIFWIYTLIPILKKIEEKINKEIVQPYNSGIKFAFDYKNVAAFQEDLKDKVAVGLQLMTLGYTTNEINEKLGLGFDEEDWRDIWWVSSSLTPVDIAMNPPDDVATVDPDLPPDEQKKGLVDITVALKTKVVQKFLAKQDKLERELESKIRKYFYNQRSTMLSNINQDTYQHGAMLLHWGHEDDALVKVAKPIISRGVVEGVRHAQDLVEQTKSFDQLGAKVDSYITMRVEKLKIINQTIKKQVEKKVSVVLEAGIKNGDSIQVMVDSVKNAVRDIYNLSSSRALVIARTETAGAVNGGANLYYQEVGIKKKQWLTAGDELVRESHREQNGQEIILGQRYKNGLQYPNDPEGDPGEICNCRCTELPIA